MDIYNSIYGYPSFDLWISIIQFMCVHNQNACRPHQIADIQEVIAAVPCRCRVHYLSRPAHVPLPPFSIHVQGIDHQWLWRHTYWLRSWHQIHVFMDIHNSELWIFIKRMMDIHNSELWISIIRNYGYPHIELWISINRIMDILNQLCICINRSNCGYP